MPRNPRRLVETAQQPVRLTVVLSPELTARVVRHHAEGGLPGKPQDTARELITAALDFPEVESSLLRSARERGYTSVRRDFQEMVGIELDQMTREWARKRASEQQSGSGDEGVGDGEQRERAAG